MVKKKKKKLKTGDAWQINSRLIYLVLILITSAVYANTLFNDYALDDTILITENSFTKEGFAGLKDIFSYDTFRGFFGQEGKDKLVSGGRYRPLSQAMFAVEYALFGKNPFIGHLMNILWYIFLICSLFFIVSQIAENFLKQKSRSLVFSAIVALIFALHPVHTEVVANIKGRDEILALLGGMWSLYFSIRYYKNSTIAYAISAGLLIIIGLLAKESAISFVAVVPLTILYFYSKKGISILRTTLPVLFGAVIYLLFRMSVIGFDVGQEAPRELMNNPFLKLVDGYYVAMTFNEKYPLIIYGLLKYLQLLIFPHPLSHDYYPRVFGSLNWSSLTVIIGLLCVAALGILWFTLYHRRKLISYSIAFFAITIFLTSNILFPVGTHISERFLFVPSLAYCLVLGGWLEAYSHRGKHQLTLFILVPLLLAFSVKSMARNAVWKNNYTLFTTDVQTSSGSAKIQNAAGGEIIAHAITQTDTLKRREELNEAIMHLKKAIEIHPGYKNAYLLLGNAHYYQKEYRAAIQYYDAALQLDDRYEEALYNRALAQRDYGRYLGERLGDLPKAIEFLEKAYTQLQDDYETNRLLGIAYGNQRQPQKAISFFKKALGLKTDDAWTNYNLGLAYLAIQDTTNAVHYMEIAKTLNPEVGN